MVIPPYEDKGCKEWTRIKEEKTEDYSKKLTKIDED